MTRTRPTKACRSGFTLVEMLFTMLVIAVLVGIGIQGMMGAVAQSRVDGAASVIATDLERAFSIASRQNAPVRIEYDAATMTYRLAHASSGDVLHSRPLGPDSEHPVGNVSFSEITLDVMPSGLAEGPLTVTVEAGDASASVEMSATGMIDVEQS